MTKEERHEMIMEALIKYGSVQVSDLVTMLDVSAVTVRKDLTELEKGDKLYRSHGKAVLINPYINNRSVNVKEKLATDEKHAIGREAARLITRNDSICIASGTTVHALARNIVPIHKLTVVSASLPVSNILSQHENIDIYQLGGMLRHSSLSVVGEYASQKEALIAIGKDPKKSGISDAINGRTSTHQAYGFKWFFKDEFKA